MTLLLAIISLVLGLYFLRINIVISVIIVTIFFLYIIFRYKDKRILIFIGTFAIGLTMPLIPLETNPNNNIYVGVVVESKDNYYLFQSGFEKFYVYEKENKREIGDFLEINSKPYEIRQTTYESQFSFKEYLNNKGVKRELYSTKVKETFLTPFRLKEFRNSFLSKYDAEEAFLIDAILFCNKNYESSAINLASELNLLYLLSMSGIYIYFLIGLLKKLFHLFLPEKFSELIPFVLLFPYTIFTFPKLGIIRVMTMYFAKYLNKFAFKNKFSNTFLLSSFVFVLVIVDYHIVYQEAFYIGFSLSLLVNFINPILNNFKKKYRAILFSLLIYLFLLPVSNLLKGELRIFSLLFQIILIPVTELFTLVSLLSFYIYTPMPFLVGGITKVITFFLTIFQKVDFSISIGDYIMYLLPPYYFGYFYVLYLLEMKRYFHISLGSMPIVSALVISIIPIRLYFTNAIYFINVGQGDSILIKNRNNIVLIDTGGKKGNDIANDSLIPFLNKKQIDHIDLLITTHNDYDHSGAANDLINNFKVNNYYTRSEQFPVKIGDIYLDNINKYKASEENDNSLVFNIDFMGKKWLLMGDASINVEKFLIDKKIDINCDVLKVGHHGSKTSTSEEFLQACSPSEAIISVGESNSYGHPDDIIIDRLNKFNVKIRRTDFEGTISFVTLAT